VWRERVQKWPKKILHLLRIDLSLLLEVLHLFFSLHLILKALGEKLEGGENKQLDHSSSIMLSLLVNRSNEKTTKPNGFHE